MSQNLSENVRPAARPAEPAGHSGFSMHTVLIAVRCWWKVAAPVGLILGVAAGVLVLYLTKPTYTAATWIEIRERPEVILNHLAAEDPRKYVQNQLELLKSPLVLDPVAALPAVAITPELLADGDAAQSLRRRLKIRAQGNSDYFIIEFTSTTPEKAALITKEVAKSYLEMQRRAESRRFEQTVRLLEQLQTSQQSIVEDHRKNLREASKMLTGKDPFAAQTDKDPIQLQNPLAELRSMLVANQLRQQVLSMELAAEKKHFEKQSFEPTTAQIDKIVEANALVGEIRLSIGELKAKIKGHEDIGVNLKQNSLYKDAQRQLADREKLLIQTVADLGKQVKESLQTAARGAREKEIADLENQLAHTEASVQFLQDKLNSETQVSKESKGETLNLEFTRAEYDRSAAIFDKIADHLLNIKMEREAPQRIAIFKEAVTPTTPDEAIPYKQIGLFGLGAFVIPFGLAVGYELLYRRVTSRDQLESQGRVRVVGEVPALPKRARSRKQQNGVTNRELQLFEESVDGLRTYLTLVESLRGMQVLAMTSAISREGKTSLASQLAVSIASATGEATLLIDGDMRSPDVHQIFGVECNPGLADVLIGACPLEDAIETEFSQNLHLLTAGQLSTSPHRLLGNGEFAALIDKLRGMYRYIIVDTPPILPASEALVMARSADAAVLCARRDYSRVDQVTEAYGRLQAAGVKAAGAVLNGIPISNYAKRYGSYYYNRTRLPRRLKKADSTP